MVSLVVLVICTLLPFDDSACETICLAAKSFQQLMFGLSVISKWVWSGTIVDAAVSGAVRSAVLAKVIRENSCECTLVYFGWENIE